MVRGCLVARKGEDIAAEIKMMRTSSSGPFLIVEGATDEKFFWPRVLRACYIAIGSGRSSVERAVDLLDVDSRGSKPDYLGVVDEDYDWLIRYSPTSQNVLKTDPRDVEGILFRSSAVSSVLAEFASREAITNFEAGNGPVLLAVLARAEPFGRIRMVNALGPMVDLTTFKPVRFCGAGWNYNLDEAKRAAVALGVAPDVPALEGAMASLVVPDIWHCVRGHDMVDILCGGLIHVLGGPGSDRRSVEKVLRQSLSKAEFGASQLFARLDAWGAANAPVLA